MDFWVLIVLSGLALTSRQPATAQDQGIAGIARLRTGNNMPSPKHPSRPSPGVHATICIFPLTNVSQASGNAGLYAAVHTRLIKQVDTDDSGRFKILLPPGIYSVFTKKGQLFFATRRDEKNNIAPVEVLPGKTTEIECAVASDRPAVY